MSDEIKKGEIVAEGGSPLPGTMTALTPKSDQAQAQATDETGDYAFELVFNSKAQLIAVNHPSNLSLESTTEHIAVGLAFLTKEVRVAAEAREEEI